MGMIRSRTVANGAAGIAALHDVNLAARYCTHVVMLFGQGQWCAGTTAQMLNESSLQRLYGCAVEELKGKEGSRFYPLPAD
jgi:iron complex transport system ATP-binding protein